MAAPIEPPVLASWCNLFVFSLMTLLVSVGTPTFEPSFEYFGQRVVMKYHILTPSFAARGSQGLIVKNGPPCDSDSGIEKDDSKWLRVMCFSDDGALFAYCNGISVTILSTRDGAEIQKIDRPRTSCLRFSPKNTYLVTWENYAVVKDQQTPPNLNFWSVKTGCLIKSAVQKQVQRWCPQFTKNEELMGRWVNNEMQYFSDGDIDRFKAKLRIDKMMDVAVATAGPPYHTAAFVKGSKGQPSFVRLFRHPNYTSPLANKSFYQADRVSLFWSPSGEHLLVLTATDSSSESYYGDQGLQYLSVDGQSNAVALGKNGPVYHVEWNPKQPEFCVVFGFMPAKAMLFNAKCEPLFDFGTGPWNLAHYNPHGNVLCLCGFGNLRGRMECWDIRKRKQISVSTAADTTQFQWCPDGEHIVTATTSPRLRVANGYKIWHYTGSLMYEEHTPHGQELWEVRFQPGAYRERPIQYSAVETNFSAPTEPVVAQLADAIPSVYRPPGARGMSQPTALHTYEKPADLTKPEQSTANLSKAALKNKKKREAKQRARQEGGQEDHAPPPQQAPPQHAHQAPPTQQRGSAPPSRGSAPPSRGSAVPNDETAKKIKNLEKKLQQIEKLKQQQREGKQLELNQLEKLKTEESLRDELADLKL